jgi:hypothetical protein
MSTLNGAVATGLDEAAIERRLNDHVKDIFGVSVMPKVSCIGWREGVYDSWGDRLPRGRFVPGLVRQGELLGAVHWFWPQGFHAKLVLRLNRERSPLRGGLTLSWVANLAR